MSLHGTIRRICIGSFIPLLLGCGGGLLGGGSTKGPDVFQVTFHQDRGTVYGGANCVTNPTLYCMTPVSADRTFTGPLQLDVATATLTADGSWSGSNDGAQVSLGKSGQCGSFLINYTTTASGITGTWSEVFDCHGANGGGTLTGTR